MIQRSLKLCQRRLNGVSRNFSRIFNFQEYFKKCQGHFTNASRVFQGRSKGISRQFSLRPFERISKGISVKFQRYFKGVSKKFQGYSKKVFMVLQGSFKGVSMEYYVDFKGSKGVQGL